LRAILFEAADSGESRSDDSLEPAMIKMLVAVLMTACVVNVACLLGHLSNVAG
jgi:hypothetical protein